MLTQARSWLATLPRDRERRALVLVGAALVVAAVARVGTAGWGLPFKYHVDELGFVMWVAAHAEWHGFVRGSFEPTVTTYGPLVYELALATKWMISGTSGAAEAARGAADGWAYLTVLDDPARTPLTMIEWIHAMRIVSGWIGVATVLVLARATQPLLPYAGAINRLSAEEAARVAFVALGVGLAFDGVHAGQVDEAQRLVLRHLHQRLEHVDGDAGEVAHLRVRARDGVEE